jgi:hypothetical protein
MSRLLGSSEEPRAITWWNFSWNAKCDATPLTHPMPSRVAAVACHTRRPSERQKEHMACPTLSEAYWTSALLLALSLLGTLRICSGKIHVAPVRLEALEGRVHIDCLCTSKNEKQKVHQNCSTTVWGTTKGPKNNLYKVDLENTEDLNGSKRWCFVVCVCVCVCVWRSLTVFWAIYFQNRFYLQFKFLKLYQWVS